jgi:transcriptional regulator with XRE-family HTH domain
MKLRKLLIKTIMENKNLKYKNNLLQFRRRSGLEPKQIIFLLSKKSKDELYRYEKDVYFPVLPTLLKLEIIYQAPLRLLFQDLFEALKTEIAEKRKSQPHLFPDRAFFPSRLEQLSQEERCFYGEILKSRQPNRTETEMITKHIIALSNTLSDFNQGRNPSALQEQNDE